MVADDAKRGMIPVNLVAQAKEEEREFIDVMDVFDVVDRASAKGLPDNQEPLGCHKQGNRRCTQRARAMGGQRVQAHGRTGSRRVLRANTRARHG